MSVDWSGEYAKIENESMAKHGPKTEGQLQDPFYILKKIKSHAKQANLLLAASRVPTTSIAKIRWYTDILGEIYSINGI